MKPIKCIISFLAFILLLSCTINKPNYNPVFISDARIKALKTAVDDKSEPQYSAFLALEKEADANINHTPSPPSIWYVPGYYRDAEGHRTAKEGLQNDANLSYTFALCYRITGDKKYAESAMRIINAWASQVDSMSRADDSLLSFSYHFPPMVFAADLLRNTRVWPESQQKVFSIFLRDNAYDMNTMHRKNNWGNWGIVLAASCAAYLEDTEKLLTCANRWKYFIESQIDEDGVLPHEIHRNNGRSGVWYSHFSLMPQTLAAEILYNNGYDLYEYVSPNNRSLKLAYTGPLAEWSANPASFPYWDGDPSLISGYNYYSYFEILNRHWQNETVIKLLKENRPLTARHSAPHLTLTHGLPLD